MQVEKHNRAWSNATHTMFQTERRGRDVAAPDNYEVEPYILDKPMVEVLTMQRMMNDEPRSEHVSESEKDDDRSHESSGSDDDKEEEKEQKHAAIRPRTAGVRHAHRRSMPRPSSSTVHSSVHWNLFAEENGRARGQRRTLSTWEQGRKGRFQQRRHTMSYVSQHGVEDESKEQVSSVDAAHPLEALRSIVAQVSSSSRPSPTPPPPPAAATVPPPRPNERSGPSMYERELNMVKVRERNEAAPPIASSARSSRRASATSQWDLSSLQFVTVPPLAASPSSSLSLSARPSTARSSGRSAAEVLRKSHFAAAANATSLFARPASATINKHTAYNNISNNSMTAAQARLHAYMELERQNRLNEVAAVEERIARHQQSEMEAVRANQAAQQELLARLQEEVSAIDDHFESREHERKKEIQRRTARAHAEATAARNAAVSAAAASGVAKAVLEDLSKGGTGQKHSTAAFDVGPASSTDLLTSVNGWLEGRSMDAALDEVFLLKHAELSTGLVEQVRKEAESAVDELLDRARVPAPLRQELLLKLTAATGDSLKEREAMQQWLVRNLHLARTTLRKSVHEYENQISDLQSQLRESKTKAERVEPLLEMNAALQTKYNKCQVEVASLKSQVAELSASNKQLEALRATQESVLSKSEEIQMSLRNERDMAREEAKVARAQLGPLLNNLSSIRTELSDALAREASMMKSQRIREVQLDAINEMFRARREMLERLKEQRRMEMERKEQEKRERERRKAATAAAKAAREAAGDTFLTEAHADDDDDESDEDTTAKEPASLPSPEAAVCQLLLRHIGVNRRLYRLLQLHPLNAQHRPQMMSALREWILGAEKQVEYALTRQMARIEKLLHDQNEKDTNPEASMSGDENGGDDSGTTTSERARLQSEYDSLASQLEQVRSQFRFLHDSTVTPSDGNTAGGDGQLAECNAGESIRFIKQEEDENAMLMRILEQGSSEEETAVENDEDDTEKNSNDSSSSSESESEYDDPLDDASLARPPESAEMRAARLRRALERSMMAPDEARRDRRLEQREKRRAIRKWKKERRRQRAEEEMKKIEQTAMANIEAEKQQRGETLDENEEESETDAEEGGMSEAKETMNPSVPQMDPSTARPPSTMRAKSKMKRSRVSSSVTDSSTQPKSKPRATSRDKKKRGATVGVPSSERAGHVHATETPTSRSPATRARARSARRQRISSSSRPTSAPTQPRTHRARRRAVEEQETEVEKSTEKLHGEGEKAQEGEDIDNQLAMDSLAHDIPLYDSEDEMESFSDLDSSSISESDESMKDDSGNCGEEPAGDGHTTALEPARRHARRKQSRKKSKRRTRNRGIQTELEQESAPKSGRFLTPVYRALARKAALKSSSSGAASSTSWPGEEFFNTTDQEDGTSTTDEQEIAARAEAMFEQFIQDRLLRTKRSVGIQCPDALVSMDELRLIEQFFELPTIEAASSSRPKHGSTVASTHDSDLDSSEPSRTVGVQVGLPPAFSSVPFYRFMIDALMEDMRSGGLSMGRSSKRTGPPRRMIEVPPIYALYAYLGADKMESMEGATLSAINVLHPFHRPLHIPTRQDHSKSHKRKVKKMVRRMERRIVRNEDGEEREEEVEVEVEIEVEEDVASGATVVEVGSAHFHPLGIRATDPILASRPEAVAARLAASRKHVRGLSSLSVELRTDADLDAFLSTIDGEFEPDSDPALAGRLWGDGGDATLDASDQQLLERARAQEAECARIVQLVARIDEARVNREQDAAHSKARARLLRKGAATRPMIVDSSTQHGGTVVSDTGAALDDLSGAQQSASESYAEPDQLIVQGRCPEGFKVVVSDAPHPAHSISDEPSRVPQQSPAPPPSEPIIIRSLPPRPTTTSDAASSTTPPLKRWSDSPYVPRQFLSSYLDSDARALVALTNTSALSSPTNQAEPQTTVQAPVLPYYPPPPNKQPLHMRQPIVLGLATGDENVAEKSEADSSTWLLSLRERLWAQQDALLKHRKKIVRSLMGPAREQALREMQSSGGIKGLPIRTAPASGSQDEHRRQRSIAKLDPNVRQAKRALEKLQLFARLREQQQGRERGLSPSVDEPSEPFAEPLDTASNMRRAAAHRPLEGATSESMSAPTDGSLSEDLIKGGVKVTVSSENENDDDGAWPSSRDIDIDRSQLLLRTSSSIRQPSAPRRRLSADEMLNEWKARKHQHALNTVTEDGEPEGSVHQENTSGEVHHRAEASHASDTSNTLQPRPPSHPPRPDLSTTSGSHIRGRRHTQHSSQSES